MKKFLLPAIFVLSIVAGRKLLSPSTPPAPPKYNHLSCIGDVRDLEVSYKGSYYIVKRALPEKIDDRIFWGGAWRTNRYAFDNQDKYSPTSAKSIAVGDDRINILKHEETVYPHDVKLPAPGEEHTFPEFDKDYVTKLYQLKEIRKGEPAIKVTYEATQTIYTCHGKGVKFVPEDMKFYVPADPYVAIAYYPEELWPEVNVPRYESNARINPCYERDMVNFKKSIHPLGFGFGWRPFDEGRDVNRNPYNCTSYYKVDDHIFQIFPKIQEKEPSKVADLDFSWFEELKRPLRATVLFGAAENHAFREFKPGEAKAYVEQYFSEISFAEAKNKLPLHQKKLDNNFSRLLMFLRNLRTHIEPRDFVVNTTSSVVQITLRGKFKLSKKDIEVFIHFSPNVPKISGYEEFEKVLSSRFLSSDILVYDGHSAGGKPLHSVFEKVNTTLQHSLAGPHPAYQIMALLSCSANGVFHPSRVPLPPAMKRDIVYGAGGYLDGPAHGALSFIVAADKYLYNQRVPYFGHWASYFQSDNSYVLYNQR